MATKKPETKLEPIKTQKQTSKDPEIVREDPEKAQEQASLAKDIEAVISELQRLAVLSDPEDRRTKSLADILSLSNSACTKSVAMLEEIKKKI